MCCKPIIYQERLKSWNLAAFSSSDFETGKRTSLLGKGAKIISKNGNRILSMATGIKTEFAASAMRDLAVSAEAARNGKYKIAAAAGLSSISEMMLSGMNLFYPKELRELNKLTHIQILIRMPSIYPGFFRLFRCNDRLATVIFFRAF